MSRPRLSLHSFYNIYARLTNPANESPEHIPELEIPKGELYGIFSEHIPDRFVFDRAEYAYVVPQLVRMPSSSSPFGERMVLVHVRVQAFQRLTPKCVSVQLEVVLRYWYRMLGKMKNESKISKTRKHAVLAAKASSSTLRKN
jgi:hypothetical protein